MGLIKRNVTHRLYRQLDWANPFLGTEEAHGYYSYNIGCFLIKINSKLNTGSLVITGTYGY